MCLAGKELFDAQNHLPPGRFGPPFPAPSDQSIFHSRRVIRQSAGPARVGLATAQALAQAALNEFVSLARIENSATRFSILCLFAGTMSACVCSIGFVA